MKKLILLTFLFLYALAISAENVSPYAGQELRSIKALSQDKVAALLEGKGLGYAKVAELNGLPGPAHVLELADQLQLNDEQILKTNNLFEEMQFQARRLGADLIEAEKQLDVLFVSGGISEEVVLSRLEGIAAIEGRLRATHVNAHIKQKEVLTPHQVHKYITLRGYTSFKHHESHHHH